MNGFSNHTLQILFFKTLYPSMNFQLLGIHRETIEIHRLISTQAIFIWLLSQGHNKFDMNRQRVFTISKFLTRGHIKNVLVCTFLIFLMLCWLSETLLSMFKNTRVAADFYEYNFQYQYDHIPFTIFSLALQCNASKLLEFTIVIGRDRPENLSGPSSPIFFNVGFQFHVLRFKCSWKNRVI